MFNISPIPTQFDLWAPMDVQDIMPEIWRGRKQAVAVLVLTSYSRAYTIRLTVNGL